MKLPRQGFRSADQASSFLSPPTSDTLLPASLRNGVGCVRNITSSRKLTWRRLVYCFTFHDSSRLCDKETSLRAPWRPSRIPSPYPQNATAAQAQLRLAVHNHGSRDRRGEVLPPPVVERTSLHAMARARSARMRGGKRACSRAWSTTFEEGRRSTGVTGEMHGTIVLCQRRYTCTLRSMYQYTVLPHMYTGTCMLLQRWPDATQTAHVRRLETDLAQHSPCACVLARHVCQD